LRCARLQIADCRLQADAISNLQHFFVQNS
jgi:hypothetical protein